jgi:DNA mismatch repair protein MutL
MKPNDRKIQILSENLINKIAAGEVIDRPASVIKELVENAIDAGSTRISVIVKAGGSGLLQVVDDGCGMSEEDAILSMQRHATSKIRTYRDVEHISTLGFRGEALASIAAVARVELKTVPQGRMEGTFLTIEGGAMGELQKTGGNSGTSIAVKTLFFNTPARRKFLRTESTEYRYILAMMNRFTLAYPEIAFTMVNETNTVFDLKPASLQERIAEVLGNRVANNLIVVKDDNTLAPISGFVGNFDALRRSKNDQYLFLNRRYINDRTLSYAIASAFGESIPIGQYPLYVLFLDIDPERVDVNVHPTKSEVKFADQKMLYDLVRGAVKRALQTDSIIPELQRFTPGSRTFQQPRFQSTVQKDIFDYHQTRIEFTRPSAPIVPVFAPALAPQPSAGSTDVGSVTTPAGRQEESSANALVWQMQNKYVLAQIKSGLVVIDQHAAHERILYEKAKKSFTKSEFASQQLLFPQTIDLTAQDYQYIQEILPLLEKLGFMIKCFGGHTIVVEGVPVGLRRGGEEKILLELLEEYKENLGTEVDIQERVAKSWACRNAIMTGDKLSTDAMSALIDQLFATQNPYFCPHGRPVVITISTDELDKRFERS